MKKLPGRMSPSQPAVPTAAGPARTAKKGMPQLLRSREEGMRVTRATPENKPNAHDEPDAAVIKKGKMTRKEGDGARNAGANGSGRSGAETRDVYPGTLTQVRAPAPARRAVVLVHRAAVIRPGRPLQVTVKRDMKGPPQAVRT